MPSFRFPKQARLIKTDDFSSVFNLRKRITGHFVAWHYQRPGTGFARLGLIVGKKNARKSVDRNYMKRVLREWFRTHCAELGDVDLIIRVQRKFDCHDYRAVCDDLEQIRLRFLKPRMLAKPQSELLS